MTREEILFVRSLGDKKVRDAEGLFVVEGRKSVEEFAGFKVREIYKVGENVSSREMERVSFLTTPTDVLAVMEKPRVKFAPEDLRGRLVLALDEVQNPGNVGTIVRLADWFGIGDILCSAGTADVFGPKVVQATMGSLARVGVHYGDLAGMIAAVRQVHRPGEEVYGAFLEGENIYGAELCAQGIVVLGSEGRGISSGVEKLVTRRLFIPRFGGGESLNVGVAAGIICSEFRKKCLTL